MSENACISGDAISADAGQSNEAIARAERSAALATLAITREEERSERENDEKHEINSASVVASRDIVDSVKLRVGGLYFEAEKSTLLRFRNTFFHGLFSSGAWQPEADGAHFIDRPAMGFERILEYLSSDKLSVEGLSEAEENCVYSSLDYLLIPYKRQWKYDTKSLIEGFMATLVCELNDGRLCGAYENDISVWNMDSNASEITMKGHTDTINLVIQLKDGRVCSCSDDTTIKLWNTESGLCEIALTGHTDWVSCTIQLFDERLCSGSWDSTIRVWNGSTGGCEMTLITQFLVYCIVQLIDGRICCGGSGGSISIYSLLTGECELSWMGHTDDVYEIVCIDATRVCSDSTDRTVDRTLKVWSTATGECVKTVKGYFDRVSSMVLLKARRLCSHSWDGSLQLWNLETRKCESTLMFSWLEGTVVQVLQLNDGRFAVLYSQEQSHPQVWLWS